MSSRRANQGTWMACQALRWVWAFAEASTLGAWQKALRATLPGTARLVPSFEQLNIVKSCRNDCDHCHPMIRMHNALYFYRTSYRSRWLIMRRQYGVRGCKCKDSIDKLRWVWHFPFSPKAIVAACTDFGLFFHMFLGLFSTWTWVFKLEGNSSKDTWMDTNLHVYTGWMASILARCNSSKVAAGRWLLPLFHPVWF